MPSALLFILLGVMWAAVLVPMWLRKHDEADESRSVDRFHRALSSLGRGSRHVDDDHDTVALPTPRREGREVVMPGRPASASRPQVTVSGPPAPPRTAADRRRRLVLMLLLLAAALLAGGLLHRIPVWLAAVPVVLAGLLVVAGRREAMRQADMARRRAHRQVLSAAARAAAEQQAARPSGARRGERVEVSATVGQAVEADDVRAAPTGRWHAVPTTLPTYVTAPAASSVPRVIDRATPGGLSGAAMVDQARRTRHVEPADDSGMRVETFEIAVPRAMSAEAEFAERYVDVDAGAAELAAVDDEEALLALLDDPRTGYTRPAPRRAAG